MTTEKIITATDSDKVLRGVRAAINLNKWDFNIVKPCKATKDELMGTLLILRSQCYSKKGVKKKVPVQSILGVLSTSLIE